PDPRIKKLAELVNPARLVPAAVEFVDIAGLVKGASLGEGLGNKFLSHIRECHAIAQVLRFFEDADIMHVHGGVNPKIDMDVVHLELMLADLETIKKRLSDTEKKAKSGDKEFIWQAQVLAKVRSALESETLIIRMPLTDGEKAFLKTLQLLTAKPMLYIANLKENELAGFDVAAAHAKLGLAENEAILPISAKVEEDLADFTPEEAEAYLLELGLKESGLNAVIHAAYRLLGLQTYFTAGPTEVRAWTIRIGAKGPEAAGVIHTDFERGFIKAETIAYDDYIACGGEVVAREKGKLRQEGREYVVRDGDVMHFKFNV
ncbi:MAG: redox-regulated ATPase YchF, partial [Candidatus Peregrinibacteria bacterium]